MLQHTANCHTPNTIDTIEMPERTPYRRGTHKQLIRNILRFSRPPVCAPAYAFKRALYLLKRALYTDSKEPFVY